MGYFLFISAIFCICCVDAQWQTFHCYQGNNLTHLMLITAFGLSVLVQRWLRGVGSLDLTEFAVGLDDNYITHLFQIAENTLPRLAAKSENAPNTQNSYCLAIVWTASLFIGGEGGGWNIWKNRISYFL